MRTFGREKWCFDVGDFETEDDVLEMSLGFRFGTLQGRSGVLVSEILRGRIMISQPVN